VWRLAEDGTAQVDGGEPVGGGAEVSRIEVVGEHGRVGAAAELLLRLDEYLALGLEAQDVDAERAVLLIGPAGRDPWRDGSDRALRLQAIGNLLDLRQDLLQEQLSLGDPIGAGPQDLAHNVENDLHLFSVLDGTALLTLRTGSRRRSKSSSLSRKQLRGASPVRRGDVADRLTADDKSDSIGASDLLRSPELV